MPNIPMTANIKNAPAWGGTTPDATNPFIVPRWDGITVRFNATVKLDINDAPQTRYVPKVILQKAKQYISGR
jgi:hypothetical protein